MNVTDREIIQSPFIFMSKDPFQLFSMGLFPRRICEIDPVDLCNISSVRLHVQRHGSIVCKTAVAQSCDRILTLLLLHLQVRGKCSICLWEAVCSTARFTRTEPPSHTTTAPPAPARYRSARCAPPPPPPVFLLNQLLSQSSRHLILSHHPPCLLPGLHGGVQEAVLSARELPGPPVLRGVSVLCEGGGGEVLQSPKQDLQGKTWADGWMKVGWTTVF